MASDKEGTAPYFSIIDIVDIAPRIQLIRSELLRHRNPAAGIW
jgi:hypothetical protein